MAVLVHRRRSRSATTPGELLLLAKSPSCKAEPSYGDQLWRLSVASDAPHRRGADGRTMPLEGVCKLSKASAGSTWELIEQTRHRLAQTGRVWMLESCPTPTSAPGRDEPKRISSWLP
jgi:hypothetical protein